MNVLIILEMEKTFLNMAKPRSQRENIDTFFKFDYKILYREETVIFKLERRMTNWRRRIPAALYYYPPEKGVSRRDGGGCERAKHIAEAPRPAPWPAPTCLGAGKPRKSQPGHLGPQQVP